LAFSTVSTDSSTAGSPTVYGELQDGSELKDGKASFSGGAIGGITVGCCAVLAVVILLFAVRRSRLADQGAEIEIDDGMGQRNGQVEGEWDSVTTLDTNQTVIEGFSNPVTLDEGRPEGVGETGVMLLGEGANQLWE
jgi:hypothetical protein